MLDKAKIENALKSQGVLPPKIIYYDSTDSTNTRAREYAKENPDSRETVVFIADSQTAGRGRRGRSFVSNSGTGIYISILTYPDELGYDATKVTAGAAVALARAIESVCSCRVGIKWVNDIYLNGKKLAGILTEAEMSTEGKITYQVVGMGINVYKNAISEEISTIATSIEHHTDDVPSRSDLAAKIISEFLSVDNACQSEYKSRSIIIGKSVTVIKPSESYAATVLDINEDFSLKLATARGIEDLFTGEVSLKI